jgi:hypothetical protein
LCPFTLACARVCVFVGTCECSRVLGGALGREYRAASVYLRLSPPSASAPPPTHATHQITPRPLPACSPFRASFHPARPRQCGCATHVTEAHCRQGGQRVAAVAARGW